LPSKEDKPEPPPAPAKPAPSATAAKTESVTAAGASIKLAIDDEDDPLYHMKGEAVPAGGPVPFSHPDEYDFFQFVGFRHAISHPLYDALVIYSHQHQLTVTQITRQSIAKFIGRPELGQDPPPPPAESEKPESVAEDIKPAD
jgi:hypothetical protein